jgi:cell division protein FtsZ
VVATGIDAKAGQAEVPVPRRRMADPIPETRIAPDAGQYEPAPQRHHHAPASQAPEPAQQYEPEPEEERSFYGDYVARDQNDLFGDVGAEQEEVPVYRTARSGGAPQQARHTPVHPQPQPRPHSSAAIGHNDHPADFVAPQSPRRAPGEPSPEALQRLQAAINRGSPEPRPEEARVAAPRQDAPPRPHGGVARTPAPEADRGGAAGGRFGINSLINRMTGHGQPSEAERPAMRRQPPQVAAYDDEQDGDPDRARVEIPAFMRRQAN